MTSPPEDRMAELRELFFETAGELVQNLNEQAMQLERSPDDAETVRSLRRTVHTLKGDAAACGFRELSELAHQFEDVLTLENAGAAASVPDVALRAADVFTALLEAYRRKKKLPNLEPLREEIARLAHPEPGSAGERKTAKSALPAVPWSEYEQMAIAKAEQEGKRVYHVRVQLDPQCAMPIAARQMIKVALAALGEVLAVYPGEGERAPLNRVEVALASEKSAEQIRVKCRIPTVAQSARVTAWRGKTASSTASPAAGPERKSEIPVEAPAGRQAASPSAEELPVPATSSGADNILRVDADKIDNVLNLVGELILAKSMFQQTMHEFGQRFPKDAMRGKFADVMAFQARVLNDLQRSVMKIRMVPVEQLFRRFPRVVRDVARQCGKEIELIVQGGNTDLDKRILDAIAEPLTHLVRNAVGHGIETGEERARAGKRAQGTLRLNAYHQGNQVVIEVADDGNGIDVEKVRQRALSQRLLTAEAAGRLTEAETLDLIFRPGFSTAEEITELSGRGVGLDVVQSVLERLKGTVQIETERGRGTTFRLRLPLTLAIIKALLFGVEQRLYAIPLNAVAEIARTFEEEVHQVEHYEVLQRRNEVLPLLRLGVPPQPGVESAGRKIFVLVISTGDRKFGLMVDTLVGEEELVIKALDDQSISTDLVSGASILGDGRVVLILNLTALVERFTKARTNQADNRLAGLLWSGTDRALRARTTAGGQA
ncbi:MAG: chemotaxis protein CheA [Candidatus Koribacter versatilis]|nr:chemotaxis protein CheA [Candidatus Koribacter versatilis]